MQYAAAPFLCLALVGLVTGHDASAREARQAEVSKPSAVASVTAAARILSGVRLNWSSAGPEGVQVMEGEMGPRADISKSRVARRRTADGTREVYHYVDFA